MAWIESHQKLRSDPKLRRFCRAMGISRKEGIGSLHLLWWWSLDHAEDGDLANIDPEDVAVAMDFPEDDCQKLMDALKARSPGGDSGWVEDDGKIHAWMNYAGRLIRDRERKRGARSVAGKGVSTDSPQKSEDSPGNSTLDTTNQPTVHNTTKPTKGTVREGFDAFWVAYPKKVGKKAAKRAWGGVKADRATVMESLVKHSASFDWTKEGGKYIPHPATWLNGERWNDEVRASSGRNARGEVTGAAAPVPGKYAKAQRELEERRGKDA